MAPFVSLTGISLTRGGTIGDHIRASSRNLISGVYVTRKHTDFICPAIRELDNGHSRMKIF